jgi:polyisoprenyl-phosphate glycosyltransferase
MSSDIKISVVIPVYGCNDSLPLLYERLKTTLSSISPDFEIILVSDGCPNNSWETVVYLSSLDPRVKGIKLSKNFGQHRALTAGLENVNGEWIVVMDCDLQDQPEEILKLYQKALEGYDIVFGQRVERQDPFFKRYSSRLFRIVFNYLSGLKIDYRQANFGIFSKKVVANLLRFREQFRGFSALITLVGFRKTAIPVNHAKRQKGNSSYNLSRMVNLALDGIVAHSNKPLKISIQVGFIISLSSLVYSGRLIYRYVVHGIPVAGWTSTMVTLFFLFGLLFAFLGIIGIYLGKIFDEIKARPLYVIDEKINFNEP